MSYFPTTMCIRIAGALSSVVLLTVIALGAHPPDYRAVAERIVGQCVNVTEGDRVVIRGDARDFDLIEEITLAAARRSAEAIQIVSREKAARRYFDQIPAERDTLPPSLSLKLIEAQTVAISIEGQEFPDLFADVPRERLVTVAQRYEAMFDAQLKHNVRSVFLGNGLGINPNVKVPPGSKLVSWVASGMVTLGTGGNGGSNTSLIGAVGSLNGATVTLDGQTIVDRGELSVQ